MAQLCKYCGLDSLEIDIREGIVVCTSCGVVAFNKLISDEADWRNFGGDEDSEDKSRVGISDDILLDSIGLQSTICGNNQYAKASRNNSILKKQTNLMMNINKKLTRYSEELKLCKRTLDIAKSIYLKCTDLGHIKHPCLAAIIQIACRISKTVRNLSEISCVTNTAKSIIQSQYLVIINTLHLSIPRITSEDYIQRFGVRLSLSRTIIETAIRIVEEVKDKNYVIAKGNISLSAACLLFSNYMIGDKEIGVDDMAKVADLSSATIKNTYSSMYSHREDLAFYLWKNNQLNTIKSKTDLYKVIDSLPDKIEVKN